MTRLRTSSNSPLMIAEIPVAPRPGYLGLTICPGKKDPSSDWDRDLVSDIAAIRAWGATTVITLIEEHEFNLLRVTKLGALVREAGMAWHHLPIVDVSIPDQRFEKAWLDIRETLHAQLDVGERILIHCRGGLGRTGLVAGVILVERGIPPPQAIQQVRNVRPNAIETWKQEDYVRNAQILFPHVCD